MAVVLVTGCSSGIGAATARRLLADGHVVVATARRVDALGELAAAGARVLPLDVTDEASMRDAVGAVEAEHGAVGALVNNAGYGLQGPFEETPLDEVRRQLETNVVGLVRLTQLVLPAMRAAGTGRVVNVSSMGGRFSLPGGAFYHASKHAVEALSDSLRLEVAPFGIRVAIVEPGPVLTPWVDVAAQHAAEGAPDGAYASFRAALQDGLRGYYTGPRARLASTPEQVAARIAHAVASPRPHTRYRVGPVARALTTTRWLLPDRVWDASLRWSYPTPRPAQPTRRSSAA